MSARKPAYWVAWDEARAHTKTGVTVQQLMDGQGWSRAKADKALKDCVAAGLVRCNAFVTPHRYYAEQLETPVTDEYVRRQAQLAARPVLVSATPARRHTARTPARGDTTRAELAAKQKRRLEAGTPVGRSVEGWADIIERLRQSTYADEPRPCPVCKAVGDAECMTSGGKPYGIDHAARHRTTMNAAQASHGFAPERFALQLSGDCYAASGDEQAAEVAYHLAFSVAAHDPLLDEDAAYEKVCTLMGASFEDPS